MQNLQQPGMQRVPDAPELTTDLKEMLRSILKYVESREREREHRGRGEEERVKERKIRADNIIRGTSPIKTTLEEDKRMRIYDTLILFLCFLGYVIMVVQVRIYTKSIISPLSLYHSPPSVSSLFLPSINWIFSITFL